jgi:hypothetical protein
MQGIGFAIVFGLGGLIVAVLYTFAIGLAGAPGALLSSAAARRSSEGATPLWGLLLTVGGQLYVSMAFVTLVIHFVGSRLSGTTGPGRSVAWIVAFFVAVAPPVMALRDAARARVRNVQHIAMAFTAPLTIIGFFLLKFFPAIMNTGWGWVPQF